MKVVTAAEIKAFDKRAASDFKIPSLLLMENAGRGLVDQMEKTIGPLTGLSVTILCGSGNNGGDGLAAARHLRMRRAEVLVYLFSPIEKIAGDARIMLSAWIGTGGALCAHGSFSLKALSKRLAESALILDALLGTGLSHPVEGIYRKAIARLNQVCEKTGIPVISVDIPSGISADTGEALGIAVKADYTFTMALPKRGLFMREGLTHRGKWDCIDIGFPQALIDQGNIPVDLLSPLDIPFGRFHPRPMEAHKGDFGHLLLIAGSLGKCGAAAMAALAALRCGTGLVTVALPQSVHSITSTVMEAMTLPLPETEEGTLSQKAETKLLEAMRGKTAIAIGPGLSQNPQTMQLLFSILPHIRVPLVMDADGINALATSPDALLKQPWSETSEGGSNAAQMILTPHPGEMGRLLGLRASAVQKDRLGIASQWAKQWNKIIVLKGAHTVIAAPDGSLFLSNTGNPGMATAGTGDVLTGIIGGALAQGARPLDAACLGVVLHGLAGDIARGSFGERCLIARDLIEKIPAAMAVFSGPPRGTRPVPIGAAALSASPPKRKGK